MAEQPFTVNDMNVEDDATFDTDTLVVDGTNNRVGILVAAPTVTFDVAGSSLFTGTVNVTSSLTLGTGGTAYVFPTTDGGSGEALVSDGAGNLTFTAVGAGSVTSVGITPGTGISVSGSPITTSGSITVTNTGVTSLVAGSNIAISGGTGAVTISSTDQFTGTVTSVATSSGTFVSVTGGTITTTGTISSDLSATGTAGATTFLRGDNTWATPSGAYTSWTLAGDSGSPQAVTDGNTATFTAGSGISTSAGATDTLTITNTGVTSNVAGSGISVSGATGAVTIANTGVTSIVAGTNVSISGATGAVTINSTDQFTGTVTSVATSSGTFVDITGGTITGSGTITGDLSATGTASGSTYLRGDNTWASIPGGYTSWTLSGDSGVNQAITDGNTVDIAGGTGISTVASATDTVTIGLDNTAVSAGSYTYASLTVDAQGRLTAASSGSSPGTMSSFDVDGSSGSTQTISNGNTLTIAQGTGITSVASATDTITITNTGVTSAVAGSGISVSGATGAVTIANTGVTSIVAGTNISISGATGAVTINSTDQFTGTVTSVATSSGTFVDVSGGTITTSGTITSDLSATGTASASTYLRGDNTWATIAGDITDVVAGTGLSGGGTSGSVTLAVDYLGIDNFIDSATDLEGTPIASADSIVYHDTGDNNVKKGLVSDLPFTNTSGTVTSVAATAGTGISISGSPITTSGTLTIGNTGVTSNVAGSGISVSGATGAVTIANTGVTSIVAGTNISISGATGAVTINSTDQFAGTVTSVATSSGTFVDITGGTITTSGTITGDLSATGTASASTYLRGDNTWASVPGGYTSWTLAGDSGVNQAITDGNTATIAGGTALSTVGSATDTLTINLDNTAVTPGSYTYSTVTVDQQGRLTSASSGASPGTMSSFTLAGDSGTPQTISDGNTATFTAGSGISTVASTTDTLTITNTGVTSNVAGTGISVSGATGAVTIGNTGVTSIVAGTNISISGGTGAVTISSTDQFAGTVTSVATSSGTFVDVTGGTITTSGTISGDLSATGTPSASTYLRGDNTWASVPGGYTSWTLAGDSGVNQAITDGNTATIAGGTGLSSIASATDTVTLNLDNTAVSAGSYTYASITVDAQGRLTAASSGSSPGTMSSFTLAGDSGSPQTISNGNTMDIAGGTGISTAAGATDTVTITNTGVTSNVAGSGISVSGPTGAVTIANTGVTSIVAGTNVSISGSTGAVTINSTDQFSGTVTSVATSSGTFVDITGGTITSTGTITGDLSATGIAGATTFLRGDNTWATPAGGGTMSTWTLSGDSGVNQTISDGDTVDIAGGTGISSVASATDTVTLSLDNTAVSAGSYTYASLTVDAQGRLTAASSGAAPGTMSSFTLAGSSGSSQTISNGNTLTIAQGTGITSVASATDTVTITNTGVTSAVAGSGISVSGATGAVTIANTGVTSIVAGTNVSISGATGAVTVNSTDQFTGTVTSVATSSGTFVDITGGTITSTGTITGDLSATGTASGSTFLRGDNTWATPSGGGTMSSFTLAGDSGSSQTITDGNTMDIAGGTGISTVAGATDTVTITNTGVTSAVAGTGIDVSGATGAVTITTDVSDFMTNGVNNRVLTATGTDAMNAEVNMTFDGSTLDVLGAGRTYQGSTTIYSIAATTILTAANDAGKYLIKTHTSTHTFNLPAASSVGEHYTIVYGPAATTTSGQVTITAAAGDNITWYDGSASVYANSIGWTPKAGSAITIICSSASSAWVAIGTDQ